MTFRICHANNFHNLIEYDKQEEKFHGLLGGVTTFILKTLKSIQNWNVTVEIQSDQLGVGVYRDNLKRYDGCLGELQMNRSDMVAQMSPYPVDIEDVSQGIIFYETSLVFISAYNKTELGGSAQVTESFDGFTSEVWCLCLFTCLTLSLVLSIGRSIRLIRRNTPDNQQGNFLYQVLTHCTGFGQMQDGGLRRRLIFLSASVFSLLVVHYFSSMIKTELVVIKDPLVYRSYDDIMKRGAIPLFMKGMNYNSLLSGPSAEPFRKRLWDYAINNFSERRLYIELSPFFFLIMSLSVFKQKVIVLLDEAIMPVVSTSGCALAKRDLKRLPAVLQMIRDPIKFKEYMKLANIVGRESELITNYTLENDVYLYSEPEVLQHVSRDPQEIPYYQGLIFNRHSSQVHKFIKSCRFVIEHGLAIHMLKLFEQIDLFENNQYLDSMLGPPLASRNSEVKKCMSKSIVQPTLKFQAIKLNNLTSLVQLVGSIYAVLLLVLCLEKIWSSLFGGISNRKRRTPAGLGLDS